MILSALAVMIDSQILFIDPELDDQAPVLSHLRNMGLHPVVCHSADALEHMKLQDRRIDLALVGTSSPNGDLHRAVTFLRAMDDEIVTICATDPATLEESSAATGTDEIIERPYCLSQVEGAVRMGLELRRLRDESKRLRGLLERRLTFHGLIGGSEPMRSLYRYLEQVACATAPVLIHTDPGTEIQETVLALHGCSARFERMVKRFDATYLEADDLVSFVEKPAGMSPIARAGTLWIDNIERLKPACQKALLDLLTHEEAPGEWRLVTSSERDLHKALENGHFRRDLYYRINIFTIRIPALRERLEDLPLLAAERLRTRGRFGISAKRLSYDALMAMSAYGWPGNVAELTSALRHAADRSEGETIELEALPADIASSARGNGSMRRPNPLRVAKATFETEYYRDLLRHCRGNMSAASKISKVGRPYLYKKIRECNLDPESFRIQ